MSTKIEHFAEAQRSSLAQPILFALVALVVLSTSANQGSAQSSSFDHYQRLFRPWAEPRPQGTLPGHRAKTKLPPSLPGSAFTGGGEPGSSTPEIGSTQAKIPAHLRRQRVSYSTSEPAGTIVVDTANTYLYLVIGNAEAIRYGIGVGREGFTWAGRERISRMAEWPDWRPPKEMLEREPSLPDFMPGGLDNPLGARALYLGRTLYRIHGTNQPSTIGKFVSSGCIRMRNVDVMDLYRRVSIGTQVIVLDGSPLQTLRH